MPNSEISRKVGRLLKKHTFILTVFCLFSFQNRVQGQWVPAGGPDGGSSYAFAERGDTIFTGSLNGVFFSTDKGESWHAANNGLDGGVVSNLAVSGNSILAGTSKGIYRSTNNGALWKLSNTGLTHTRVRCIVVSGDSVFIATDNQYGTGHTFLSTNHGASWNEIKSKSQSNIISDLLFINGTLIAGTLDGCYISAKDDTSFTKVTPDLHSDDIACFAMSGTTVLAGIWSGGIIQSPDSGKTWSKIENSLSEKTVSHLAVYGNYLFAGIRNGGIYRSSNNGLTWAHTSAGLKKSSVLTLHVSDNTILAGTINGGIYRSSDDGLSWTAVNTGFFARRVAALVAEGSSLFAGTNGGVHVLSNSGTSWDVLNNGLANPDSASSTTVSHLAVSNGSLFAVSAAGTNQGIFRSTDNGASWALANTGLPQVGISGFAANNEAVFASNYEGVYRTSDNGNSWVLSDSGLPAPRVASLTASGNMVFASIVNGAAGPGGAYMTSDNGSSWVNISEGLPLYEEVASLIKSGDVILAGTYGSGIYRSADNGASWMVDETGSLTGKKVIALAETNNNIFAGTYSNGIFLSTDNGISWTPVSTGLPKTDTNKTTPVTSLVISGDHLFAGTDFNSVWRRPLSEMISPTAISSSEQQKAAMQTDFRVSTSGGFHSDVVLSYRIQSRLFVQLGIYTVVGEKVKVFQHGEQQPGVYRIRFKESISAGLYFVHFQAGSYRDQRIIHILK